MEQSETPTDSVGKGQTNTWAALINWVDRPMRTIRYAISHPRTWFVPALLIVASMIVLTIVSAPMAAEQANEQMEAQLSRMAIPEEQQEIASRFTGNFTPGRMILTGTFGGLAVLGLGWVFSAAVFHFSALVLGGDSRFPEMFSMVLWTGLPYFVRNIVQTAYVAWTGRIIATPGLSALVASGDVLVDSQSIWYVILSSVDLFLLWHLVLSSLGISAISGFSRAKSGFLRILWWAVFAAVRLIPVLIGGAFMSS